MATRTARLTGEVFTDKHGERIYRLTCPYCGELQWHLQGRRTCIYSCGKKFLVTPFTIIRPVTTPGKEDD
jgi:hypothetical protein